MNKLVQSLLSQTSEQFNTLGRDMLSQRDDLSAGACFVAARRLLELQDFDRPRQVAFSEPGQPFDAPPKAKRGRKPKQTEIVANGNGGQSS